MKKLRNFLCSSCGLFERFVDDDIKEIECKCGEKAQRQLSAPKCFQNTTGKSPSC